MAFNWPTFRTRALTALVFVAVMLAGLLWDYCSFFVLFSIIHFGCWVEYQKLIKLIDRSYREISVFHEYGIMIAGWCLMLYMTNDTYNVFGFSLHETGWWLGLILLFALPIVELLFSRQVIPKNIGYSLFGLLYISLSLALMLSLYQVKKEIHLNDTTFVTGDRFFPLIIIAGIWINDTMAYLVGSFIGKTPLSKISPKKTWEGTIGGVLLSVITVGILFSYIYNNSIDRIFLLLVTPVALIAAVAGTFGDLLESKLKRLAGVKDSGKIMPGHGGFLDRFDSLLVATPFAWLYVYLVL